MKAGKVVRWIITVIIIIVVAFVIFFNLAGNSMIRKGIEVGGSSALGVDVAVDSVKLSLMGAKFNANGLVVGNPEGYKTESMFEMKKMLIDTSIGGIMGDTIVIDEIILDGMAVTLEQKGLTNNIQQVLAGIKARSEKPDKPEEDDPDKPSKKIIIKRLLINEAAVKTNILMGEKTVGFTLAPIEMKDLGTDEPMDIAMLSGKILAAIATGIVKSGGGLLPEDMLGSMGDTLSQAKELLGESGKMLEVGKDVGKGVQEGLKGAGEGLKDVGEGLKGIFDKKK
jgi:hypothetical protein